MSWLDYLAHALEAGAAVVVFVTVSVGVFSLWMDLRKL